MLRELQNDFSDDFGTKSHITSLKLLNPENAPDAWESEALRAFEQGEKERLEVQQIDGQPYLRLMQPLIAESSCLKCHGFQGYKVGDIRGGLSTSVAMAPYLARERKVNTSLVSTHGMIWLVGLIGLGISYRRDRNLLAERTKAEQDLMQLHQRNRLILDTAGEGIYGVDVDGRCVFANTMASQLLGFTHEELIDQPTHSQFHHSRPDGSPSPEEECPVRAAYKQGKVIRGNDLYWRKDGSSFPVAFVSTPIREAEKVTGAVVAFSDITERKQMEEALQEKQNLLIEAQHIAHIGNWWHDLVTDEIFWSDYFFGVIGREPQKITVEWASEIIHPDDLPMLQHAMEESAAGKVEHDHEFRVIRPDGDVRWIHNRWLAIRDKDGKEIKRVGTHQDITERKLAEEQLRRSVQGLAEAQRIAHLGSWNLDFVNNVLTWSDEIYRIFELDQNVFNASYEAFMNAIHPDDRELVNKAYTDSVKNKTPYNISHRLLMNDGRVKYVNEKCETYYDEAGKPLRSIGTVHDITAQKVSEIALTTLKDDLENRVNIRTAELEDANKELEAFAYSVSHDLRSPLRAIDGFSNILLSDYSDKLDEEGQRLLNVVRDSTIQMAQLIDDILKFSRAGRLEINFSEIDMERMAHEVYEELHPDAGDELQVEIGSLPSAMGDSAMMRQIWVNLLSNAIKFTRTTEGARIEVGSSVEGDETVYFVRDNGAGFNMQYVDKLFGVFQRLHSVEEFEGTGIGLAIVKRIIARHGGRVWAEGKPGEGATFYFALPTKETTHESE